MHTPVCHKQQMGGRPEGKAMGMKAALHNLGCKVNAYELEAMGQLLEEAGYELVPFEPGADVYLINTCTVTNIADRKSRQMLHKAKKMNPDAIVVAAGCYAQTDQEALEKDEAVDLLLGNNQKKKIVEILEKYRREHRRESRVLQIAGEKDYEELSISRAGEHVRAYIKVQDGCNQFCTYCVIPYARGRVRSRKPGEVRREVETLAANGYREIVLTGIHLSSYGLDLRDGDGGPDLLSLLREVHEVPGIERIRLGSLEPGIITREFALGLKELPKVCPHFHLSLQSGCDRTLIRMNRRYRAGEYALRCALLREVYDNPALTTDVIVGFPGETEEDFQESMDFVDQMDFYETHIFKYSRRRGTKAAVMDGQIPETVKTARSEKMIALHHRHAEEYEASMAGKTLSVLLEEEITADGETYLVGHSREYIRTAVKKDGSCRANDIVRVKIQGFWEAHTLVGIVESGVVL